jgi:hypothetical protein
VWKSDKPGGAAGWRLSSRERNGQQLARALHCAFESGSKEPESPQKAAGQWAVQTARIAGAFALRKGRGARMNEMSHTEVMNIFSGWVRQEKKVAVLGSNSSCSISLRNGSVTLCLDDMLQLSFTEHGILRLFLRGAIYSPADPKDFPPESRDWIAGFEKGVQLRFASPEMQCFLFASGQN